MFPVLVWVSRRRWIIHGDCAEAQRRRSRSARWPCQLPEAPIDRCGGEDSRNSFKLDFHAPIVAERLGG